MELVVLCNILPLESCQLSRMQANIIMFVSLTMDSGFCSFIQLYLYIYIDFPKHLDFFESMVSTRLNKPSKQIGILFFMQPLGIND